MRNPSIRSLFHVFLVMVGLYLVLGFAGYFGGAL